MANQRSKEKAAMTFSFLKTFVSRLRDVSVTANETKTAIVERGTTTEMDLIVAARDAGEIDADMADRLSRLIDRIDSLRDRVDSAAVRLDGDK